MLRFCWLLMPVVLLGQGADEGAAIFARRVQPLLHDKCGGCHSAALRSNGLSLASRDEMLRGGKRGPAMVSGDAAHSLIVAAIEQTGALKMPPGEKLPPETVAAVRRWIELGAPWTDAPAPTSGKYAA